MTATDGEITHGFDMEYHQEVLDRLRKNDIESNKERDYPSNYYNRPIDLDNLQQSEEFLGWFEEEEALPKTKPMSKAEPIATQTNDVVEPDDGATTRSTQTGTGKQKRLEMADEINAIAELVPVSKYQELSKRDDRNWKNKSAAGAIYTGGSILSGVATAFGLAPVGKLISDLTNLGGDAVLDAGCLL